MFNRKGLCVHTHYIQEYSETKISQRFFLYSVVEIGVMERKYFFFTLFAQCCLPFVFQLVRLIPKRSRHPEHHCWNQVHKTDQISTPKAGLDKLCSNSLSDRGGFFCCLVGLVIFLMGFFENNLGLKQMFWLLLSILSIFFRMYFLRAKQEFNPSLLFLIDLASYISRRLN